MWRSSTAVVVLTAALAAGSNSGGPGLARAETPTSPTATAARGTIDYVRTIDSLAIADYAKPRSMWSKLLAWVAGPAPVPRLARPYGLTEDNRGRLIVTDPGLAIVHIFDFERRRHEVLTGRKRQRFLSPISVAVDAQDNIYVTDSALARVLVFNRKGKFLRSFGDGPGEGALRHPTGLALDPERRWLYVADTRRHQVLVFDLRGKWIKTIGRRGAGPVEFNFPTALALAGGHLYVVDAMNFRIQVLTPEGEFVRAFGQLGDRSGTFVRPKGIAADSQGNLYVVDALFETVQIFDAEGKLLYYFGSSGSAPGQFVLPSGIHIAPRDRIYVADSYNQRVQVFRYRERNPE